MRAAGLMVIGALVLVTGCGRDPQPATRIDAGPAWFEECAADRGLVFVHVRAHEERLWLPETAAGGVGLLDVDADGDLDVYAIQSGGLLASDGPPVSNRLFENDGTGHFTDVTERAGVGDTGYGMGCAAGDVDGDGDVDLYVTNVGRDTLYRNRGDGTFEDATTAAGLGDTGWGTSAAFVDIDGDRDLDLYVVRYLVWAPEREPECHAADGSPDYCGPSAFDAPASDLLYRNDGDGTFTDISLSAGLRTAFGNGLGVVCGDFDGDGRVDVYVANDGMANQLWRNVGGGRFADVALVAGCAVNALGAVEAGMGVSAADIDGDDDLDLVLAHLAGETDTAYRNDGTTFRDVSGQSGIGAPSMQRTGFGVGLLDFDADGLLDLYVAHGRVNHGLPSLVEGDPLAEPDDAFRGGAAGRFERVLPEGGVRPPLIGNGRGAAFGDVDGDGAIDIVVQENGGDLRLLRNVVPDRGHWALLDVLERSGAPALGAEVRVSVGTRVLRRDVRSAFSYCASNDPRVHIGLGPMLRIDLVEVRWGNGSREVFGPFAADAVHRLRRGDGRAR